MIKLCCKAQFLVNVKGKVPLTYRSIAFTVSYRVKMNYHPMFYLFYFHC